MRIGILALQGAFIEHERILRELACDCVELRQRSDICSLDGIVLPGGESTVQGRLLHELGMFEGLREMIAGGIPTLATCAGLILLAEEISNDRQQYFKTLPVCVKRNAYGRQLGSFRTRSDFSTLGQIDMTFIRAPAIESLGAGVSVLAQIEGKAVAVRYKQQMALAFHPELENDNRIHQAFLAMR